MIKGETKSGFKFSVDERIKKDYRLLRVMRKAQSGSVDEQLDAMDELVELVLGKKGAEKFINHITKVNDGFCPAEAVSSEIVEIITYDPETKNS